MVPVQCQRKVLFLGIPPGSCSQVQRKVLFFVISPGSIAIILGPVSGTCPGFLFSPRSMSIASSITLAQVKELFLGLSPRALVYEDFLSPEIIRSVASLYTLNLYLSVDMSLNLNQS